MVQGGGVLLEVAGPTGQDWSSGLLTLTLGHLQFPPTVSKGGECRLCVWEGEFVALPPSHFP